jgi:anti-sigma regulatory factor (Ser/Thr protein kinase)
MTDVALFGERATEARASFTVGGGPKVAADARGAVEALRPQLGDELTGDLALLISELVTNSYRHASESRDCIVVDLEVGDEVVRCSVTDRGSGFRAEPVPAERRGDGGWGLYIVDRLADRWGVHSGPPTRVWFELSR